MEDKPNGTKAAIKTISIRPDQNEYIEDNHINLSRLVQEAIDNYIKDHSN